MRNKKERSREADASSVALLDDDGTDESVGVDAIYEAESADLPAAVTAEDVIAEQRRRQGDDRFRLDWIEAHLGIDRKLIFEAFDSGVFFRGSRLGVDRSPGCEVFGETLAHWIRFKGIRCRLPGASGSAAQPQAESAVPAAPAPPPPTDAVSGAFRLVQEARAYDESEQQAMDTHNRAAYASLLQRRIEERSLPGDAAELSQIIVDWKLTTAQVERDISILRRVPELYVMRDQREAANADRVRAVEARHRLRKDYEDREREADRAVIAAEQRIRDAYAAGPALNALRSERPILFAPVGSNDAAVGLVSAT